MKNQKMYASLCYMASICLYLIGVVRLLGGNDFLGEIFWFCLGSAMGCYGGVLLNKANKDDEDK